MNANAIYTLTLESMPRLKLNKMILNFNLYLLLISSQSKFLNLASYPLPSSQHKLLQLAYYLRILNCKTKSRSEQFKNLASRYIANKRIIDWYPRHIVQHRTRVKPHPHLGLQRLQRLDAIHNQQVYKVKDKLNSATTYIYFKHYDIKLSTTPSCRPTVQSKTPHPSRSTVASGPASQTSQRSPTSPVRIRMQPMHPSLPFLSL